LADSPADLGMLLQPLVNAGVSVFHCSNRYFWQAAFDGSERTLAGWAKCLSGIPVIAVGGVGQRAEFLGGACNGPDPHAATLTAVNRLIDAGEVDLVAVGRALLADAAWVTKIRSNRLEDIHPCVPESFSQLT